MSDPLMRLFDPGLFNLQSQMSGQSAPANMQAHLAAMASARAIGMDRVYDFQSPALIEPSETVHERKNRHNAQLWRARFERDPLADVSL